MISKNKGKFFNEVLSVLLLSAGLIIITTANIDISTKGLKEYGAINDSFKNNSVIVAEQREKMKINKESLELLNNTTAEEMFNVELIVSFLDYNYPLEVTKISTGLWNNSDSMLAVTDPKEVPITHDQMLVEFTYEDKELMLAEVSFFPFDTREVYVNIREKTGTLKIKLYNGGVIFE